MKWAFILGLALAMAVVASSVSLLETLPAGREFTRQLDRTEHAVQNRNWPAAVDACERMIASWQTLRPWVELLKESESVLAFHGVLARLRWAIDMRDAASAGLELGELRTLWRHLGEL